MILSPKVISLARLSLVIANAIVLETWSFMKDRKVQFISATCIIILLFIIVKVFHITWLIILIKLLIAAIVIDTFINVFNRLK